MGGGGGEGRGEGRGKERSGKVSILWLINGTEYKENGTCPP